MGTNPDWMFFCCFAGMFMFYCAHWQTYVSGTLRFGMWVAWFVCWKVNRSSLVPSVCARCHEVPYGCSYVYKKPEVTVTLTFELQPPNPNQLIPQSQWTLVPNLKKFPQSVVEITCSQDGAKLWPAQRHKQSEDRLKALPEYTLNWAMVLMHCCLGCEVHIIEDLNQLLP